MRVIEKGSIVIKDNIILKISKTEELDRNFTAKKIIDAKSKIVMPGFINSHTHIPMSYFRGLADDLPLQEWLNNYIWPTETRFLSEEFVYDASLYGTAELVKNGIVLFNDMYFFGKQTALAATKVGIRAIVGEGVLDYPFASYTKPKQMIDYAIRQHKEFADNELIDFAIAPHSIYVCKTKTLRLAAESARNNNMLLHIHVAETEKEIKDCIKHHKKRPIHYLNDIGFLGDNVIIAHGTWVDEEEQKIIQEKNASVVICTESELKLASGFAPIKEYLQNKVNVCLGTDGVASNNNLSILEEMDFIAKLHKSINQDPAMLPASKVVKMATINSAKALHKYSEIGSLEMGKKADIILIEKNILEIVPMYNVFSHLVYTINSNAVRDVIINGKLVMENRKLINVDEDELIERAKYYKSKILEI